MIYQEKTEVLWNEGIGADYYKIGLKCASDYSMSEPGQFVMLRIGDMTPLLRRPFSIHRLIISDEKIIGIEILYKVVGQGTLQLSEYKPGDITDLLGPLGNGFSIPENLRNIFIVGGGVGIAPLYFLGSKLKDNGMDLANITVFIGCRSTEDLLCRGEFLDLGMNVHFTTDDGSGGEKGFITEPLEKAILQQSPDMICACGPTPMLKETARIAEKYRIPCQISIETMMACGIGACLGCVVETKENSDKYLHACKDGPVFDAGRIRIR
jgi:dihydroorotate dehydrogenase electron transfer subunit